MTSMLKKTLIGLGALGLSASVLASPCDQAAIEIYNQTATPLTLMTQEGQGETNIYPLHVGDTLAPKSMTTVHVESGIGTKGDAKGLLVFLNQETNKPHKFVAVDFNFKNQYWVSCKKDANVINTQSDAFKVYQLPGYKGNVKVFIVD